MIQLMIKLRKSNWRRNDDFMAFASSSWWLNENRCLRRSCIDSKPRLSGPSLSATPPISSSSSSSWPSPLLTPATPTSVVELAAVGPALSSHSHHQPPNPVNTFVNLANALPSKTSYSPISLPSDSPYLSSSFFSLFTFTAFQNLSPRNFVSAIRVPLGYVSQFIGNLNLLRPGMYRRITLIYL